MKITFEPFKEGFIGAFRLASAIVLAIVAVTMEFVSGEPSEQPTDNGLNHS